MVLREDFMSQRGWYLSLHWTARSFAVLIAGFLSLFYFGESVGPNGHFTLIPAHLSVHDAIGLSLIFLSAVSMLLAWIWEKWAGAVDVVLAAGFLGCCLLVQGMHRAWFLGPLLMLPGLLYVAAAALRRATNAAAH